MRVLSEFDKKAISAMVSINQDRYTFVIPDILAKLFDPDEIFQVRNQNVHNVNEQEPQKKTFRLLVTAVNNTEVINRVHIKLGNLSSLMKYLIEQNLIEWLGVNGFQEVSINGFINNTQEDRAQNAWSGHDKTRYELFSIFDHAYKVTENLKDLESHRFRTIEERNRKTDVLFNRLTIFIAVLALVLSIAAFLYGGNGFLNQ